MSYLPLRKNKGNIIFVKTELSTDNTQFCSHLIISPLWASFPQLWSRPSLRRCQDKSRSPQWQPALCPASDRWPGSRPPRWPTSSNMVTCMSLAQCCLRCISWTAWGRGRSWSKQRCTFLFLFLAPTVVVCLYLLKTRPLWETSAFCKYISIYFCLHTCQIFPLRI